MSLIKMEEDRRKSEIENMVRSCAPVESFVEAFSKGLKGRPCIVEKDDIIVTTLGDSYERVIRNILIRAKVIIPEEDNYCSIKMGYEIKDNNLYELNEEY